MTFENQALKSHNNALTKKLSDAAYTEENSNPVNTASSLNSFNSISVASALNNKSRGKVFSFQDIFSH